MASLSRALAPLGVGLVVGVGGMGAARYALTDPPEDPSTHYHANFAVFVDGERVNLAEERYMEDVERCKLDPTAVDPVDRAHLHQLVHDVVHVHHKGVTWGHFFTNIGWTLGDDFLFQDTGERHVAEGDRTLKFFLNGEPVGSIRNRVIETRDRLLISFGTESAAEALASQFGEVAETAEAFNQSHFDPGGCSGSVPPPTTWERIRHAFFF